MMIRAKNTGIVGGSDFGGGEDTDTEEIVGIGFKTVVGWVQ